MAGSFNPFVYIIFPFGDETSPFLPLGKCFYVFFSVSADLKPFYVFFSGFRIGGSVLVLLLELLVCYLYERKQVVPLFPPLRSSFLFAWKVYRALVVEV